MTTTLLAAGAFTDTTRPIVQLLAGLLLLIASIRIVVALRAGKLGEVLIEAPVAVLCGFFAFAPASTWDFFTHLPTMSAGR